MPVKPKAVAGISQLFRTSDVIARYTGVINRQIKTHRKDHGCLRHLHQIIKEYILPWGHILSWHSRNTSSFLVLRTCAMYWVYVMSHAYGPRYMTQSLPINNLVQLYITYDILFTQRGVGRVLRLLHCISRYTHSRSSAIVFSSCGDFEMGDEIGLFEYISFVARVSPQPPS